MVISTEWLIPHWYNLKQARWQWEGKESRTTVSKLSSHLATNYVTLHESLPLLGTQVLRVLVYERSTLL